MNEWGNNPATYQAIGAIFSSIGIIAVIIYTWLTWRLFRETKGQRQAIENEMSDRMRPWIGLFACQVKIDLEAEPETNELFLQFKNFGALPAQNARLELLGFPLDISNPNADSQIRKSEQGSKVLMPEEEGNYPIDLNDYSIFLDWKRQKRNIKFEGSYSYSLGERVFATDFECVIRFGIKNSIYKTFKFNWKNKSAT